MTNAGYMFYNYMSEFEGIGVHDFILLLSVLLIQTKYEGRLVI